MAKGVRTSRELEMQQAQATSRMTDEGGIGEQRTLRELPDVPSSGTLRVVPLQHTEGYTTNAPHNAVRKGAKWGALVGVLIGVSSLLASVLVGAGVGALLGKASQLRIQKGSAPRIHFA